MTEQILKTDKLGRVRVPVQRREALLEEFEHSGMSGAAFAKRYGINYQTFASWRQKRKKAAASSGNDGPSEFLLLEALEALEAPEDGDRGPRTNSKAGLEIELPGGARLSIRGPGQVALAAELLRALR